MPATIFPERSRSWMNETPPDLLTPTDERSTDGKKTKTNTDDKSWKDIQNLKLSHPLNWQNSERADQKLKNADDNLQVQA